MAGDPESTLARRVDARFWALVGLVCLVFVAAWATTLDASLTHDEAVYVDVAEDPLESTFYPEDTFLRHPPLGLGLLAAWMTVGLPLRAWPLVFSLGGFVLLGHALRTREASPAWLAPAAVAAPVAVPLLTVTLYPPLFFFLSLAAWAWSQGRQLTGILAWNLAVFTHELALLLLGVLLLARAASYVQEGVRDRARWAQLVWPYPAAIAWGGVMLWLLVSASDGRGSYLSTILDPSPNVAAILALKPWVGLVILVTAVPLLVHPRREGSRGLALTVAVVLAALTGPFYRYVLPVVPALVVMRARRRPRWFAKVGAVGILAASLLATGMAMGATVTGHDTLNAANMPGLVDHEEAAGLIEPGETVLVRSSPSFAHVLAEEGWQVTGTAATGPATLELARGEERIVLHRGETYERLREVDDVDALVFPATWRTVPDELPTGEWTEVEEAGGAIRWEPVEAR